LAKCTGITRDGERCRGIAIEGSDYCYAHDPDRAEERKRAASKGGKRGGRGRPQAELADIKRRLLDLADGLLAPPDDAEKRVDKGVAAVASQVLNVYLRALSVELKAREQLELIERLEALEEALEANKNGGRRWGA
jgi:hypothetical protein